MITVVEFGRSWSQGLKILDVGQGGLSHDAWSSLSALSLASELYSQFEAASFPTKILYSQFLAFEQRHPGYSHSNRQRYDYAERDNYSESKPKRLSVLKPLQLCSRAEALAWICLLESGGTAADLRDSLSQAYAVSSAESIYVSETMLSEPSEHVPPYKIRRIIGNIGSPGISVLVSPEGLKTKRLTENFRAVEHAIYDYQRENNFKGVSLHLCLTGGKMPLQTGESLGLIDQDVFLREAVVSVYDRGEWYADIDILKTMDIRVPILTGTCLCSNPSTNSETEYTSIDTFDELIDAPETVGIFRARQNWSARLAALCITQKFRKYQVFLVGNNLRCWKCAEEEIKLQDGAPGREMAEDGASTESNQEWNFETEREVRCDSPVRKDWEDYHLVLID
jgi:hypothetical protein